VANRARALGVGGASATRSRELDTQRSYSSDGLDLLEELGPQHESQRSSDEQRVQARARTVTVYDQHLPTTVRTGAQVWGEEAMADERVSKTEYDFTLRKPTAQITDATSSGANLRKVMRYDPATGLEIESRMPRNPGGGDASATKTVHYSATTSSDPDCPVRRHWAGLPCKTEPAGPAGGSLPALPKTTFAYNRFNQVTTETERAGTDNRTTTTTYDAAGRKLTEGVSSTKGTGLPVASTTYSSSSGKPVKLHPASSPR